MASYIKKYRKMRKKDNDWLNEDLPAHDHIYDSDNCCFEGRHAGGSGVQSSYHFFHPII